MFQRFYPKKMYKSTYDIDFKKYYDMGYRGILFDIDNTLVPHGADATDKSDALFMKLKDMGYKICLISNNNSERVERFNKNIKVDYICKAGKPSRKNYIKAMEKMDTDISNTLFVGDQIFTDVWGANRTGIYSMLVSPIDSKEEIQIILKRIPEKWILNSYKRYRKKLKDTEGK